MQRPLHAHPHRLLAFGVFLSLCASAQPAAAGDLVIQELALTQNETSWHGKPAWAPGETVFVRVIVVGLKRNEAGKIRVRESLELRDTGGQLLLEAKDL